MKRSEPLKRHKPLKRGGSLNRRSSRRRPSRNTRLPKRYQPTDAEITAARIRAAREFREEAQYQRVCAVCGKADAFDAHHVIAKQFLKDNGFPLYVRKNALRLCNRFSKRKCHLRHEGASRRVKLTELTDDNIEYALALLGPDRGESYLRRHYDGEDPRLERLLEDYRE